VIHPEHRSRNPASVGYLDRIFHRANRSPGEAKEEEAIKPEPVHTAMPTHNVYHDFIQHLSPTPQSNVKRSDIDLTTCEARHNYSQSQSLQSDFDLQCHRPTKDHTHSITSSLGLDDRQMVLITTVDTKAMAEELSLLRKEITLLEAAQKKLGRACTSPW
jgi:hypothetical protein